MVWLTRFDGTMFLLNGDLIVTMESTPDTVITLSNGHHFVVREAVDTIMQQIILFRHRVFTGLGEQE